VKAKFVFEFFDREDPNILKKIGIGKKTWSNLQPGDILKPKKEVKVSGQGRFMPPSYKHGISFYPQDYAVIITYKKGENRFIEYKMHLRRCWDLKEAMNVRSMLEKGIGEFLYFYGKNDAFNRPTRGSYQQWENRFEIYQG
jgi:hypothetical protein